MNQVFREGNLQLDFSKAQKVEKFDDPNTHQAPDFKKADYLVEQENNLWFIEIKEGSPVNIKKKDLPLKAKDSLLYLFLMNKYDDNQEKKYFVILDHNFDSAILTRKSDRLKQQLGITYPPWSSLPYFKETLVFNVTTWNKFFPQFPISRISIG